MIELIELPEDPEEAIFETEEMQDSILDKISKVQILIELHTRRLTGTTLVPTVVNNNDIPLLYVSSQQSESKNPPQEDVFPSVL